MRARASLSTVAAAIAVIAGLSLSGCAAPESAGAESGAAAESATRVVTTDQGDVSIPAEPQRVVLLNYALAGYLYDLDVPVVGMIPEDADADEGAFSEFWAEDAEAAGTDFLPWSTDGFDLEAILAMEPDLIIAGGLGFPNMQAVEAYDQLTAIAPTVIVSQDKTEWQDQFSYLANEVFAQPQVYDDALANYEARVAEVRDAITVPAGESIFVSLTADQVPYVLIEDQGLPAMFTDLGFTPAPLFASGEFEAYTSGGDMFELSTEQVGQVATQPTMFFSGFNGPTVDLATLQASPVYSALPSFQAGQAYELPYWSLRGDYDEALAVLDLVEAQFAK